MKYHRTILLALFFMVTGCVTYAPSRTNNQTFTALPNFIDVEEASYIWDYPFQVLSVEGGRRKGDALPLEPLEKLSIYDSIKLDSSGYMILVHYTGRFLAFEGEISISISDQSKLISEQQNIGWKYEISRAGVRRLFSTEKFPRMSRGAVDRSWGEKINIISPAIRAADISENKPQVCLLWEPVSPQPNPYMLNIKNIYDQVVDEFEVDGTSFNLDLSKYQIKPPLYLITVYDKYDHEYSSPEIGFKLGEQYQYTPFKCEMNSASEALEMGFYLESNGYYAESTQYFQLATLLSERPVFIEFLNYHAQR